jgi:hypothetical protein
MVSTLADTNMRCDETSLRNVPETFEVRWPKGATYKGVTLVPVLCEYISLKDKLSVCNDMWVEVMSFPNKAWLDEEKMGAGRSLTVNLDCRVDESGDDFATTLHSRDMADYLMGKKEMPTHHEMTDDHKHLLEAHLEAVLKLLVYMDGCPRFVANCFPGAINAEQRINHVRPQTIEPPPRPAHKGGTHASPEGHWRNLHLRRWPKRKDGTRLPGTMEIKGVWVGGKGVDPKTVLEGGKV